MAFMYMAFYLNAQEEVKPFIKIDSIYLPPDKKGRIGINFSRYLPTRSYKQSYLDFNVKETFFTHQDELKITGIEPILKSYNLFIYFSNGLRDAKNQIANVDRSIDNILKSKSLGTFNTILVSDSLGFYKFSQDKTSSPQEVDLFLGSRYTYDLKEYHDSISKFLNNAVFIAFLENNNIGNADILLSRMVPPNRGIKRKSSEEPLIVAYVLDTTAIPASLQQAVKVTKNPVNRIIADPGGFRLGRNLQTEILGRNVLQFKMTLDTKKPTYKGEQRILELDWKQTGLRDTVRYTFGSSDYPLNIKELNTDLIFWISCIFFGIIILLSIFFILSIWYPILEDKKFLKNYVAPYVPIPGIVKYDTMSNEPIEAGTLVVRKCKEVVPYYIWKGLGNQCPSYPDCMDFLGCEGNGRCEVHYKFFSQSGNMKKYNWLFYGACGGFLAWLISLITIPVFTMVHFENLFISPQGGSSTVIIPEAYFNINLINQASVGFGIGIGLGTALILADYFSSIIKPKIYYSILKILAIGVVNAWIFGLVYALSYRYGLNNFISGFISWFLFIWVLSLGLFAGSPSITFKRALIATSIGVLVSFLLYHLSSELINIGYKEFSTNRQLILELIKVLRLILLGALTGYITSNVLKRLEEYELEMLAPEQLNGRTIPISKILKSGSPVTIGSSPKNVIFIKWTDPGAEEVHARLELDNDGVVLTPHAELIVNKEYQTKGSRHRLKDKDVIQLGRHSSTLLRFNVKYE